VTDAADHLSDYLTVVGSFLTWLRRHLFASLSLEYGALLSLAAMSP
jgi:hypothetical protein